jgi:hypothetical protein
VIIRYGHIGGRTVERLFRKISKIITVVGNGKRGRNTSYLSIETIVCDGRMYPNEFFSEGRATNSVIYGRGSERSEEVEKNKSCENTIE